MVAIQAATTAVLAITLSNVVGQKQFLPNAQTDAAVKALIGLGLVLTSIWVKQGFVKSTMIGAGVGIAVGAGLPLVKSMR